MVQSKDADSVVTFDLGSFFDENSTESQEFNCKEIDDNELVQLVSNLTQE